MDQLVGEASDGFSSSSNDTSVDVKWKYGDVEFKYKKEQIGGKDWHCYYPNDKRIASVYYGDNLIWAADPGVSPKAVRAHLPNCGNNTITVEVGANEKKTFTQEFGFYHEKGTIALDVGCKKTTNDYIFTKTGNDKDGEYNYKATKENKITLIVQKKTCGSNKLYWKATGSWYCTEVALTREANKNTKMTLKLTDGSTSTDLTLVKQEDKFWVSENTVFLNTKKKDNAFNCKYTRNVQNKRGTFTYEPAEGFTISRVSHGDHEPKNLIWKSSGFDKCTKVTGNVENDETVSYELLVEGDNGQKVKLKSEKVGTKWNLSSAN
ncbi:conserved hypothetical protein [Theileria orientalis strain Shintoku]|uniref:Uncharacterized protein n=1 Tax=Theileria orientalis strain Shintoku TaxID=869250 RepID=J4DPH5_THEOR|nr:conserved hypothetical protein [Theileria orientalis strain Shintoku]BAM40714.1 conserved hypothetical protein [Theileria orientalis strain Shintoku]|eukprot:XP_009691015.1 conserved hypothetical protein [Theileria orientalis strain Shintoku]